MTSRREEEYRLELEIEKLKLELEKKDNVSDEKINQLISKMGINALHEKIDNLEKNINQLVDKLGATTAPRPSPDSKNL